MLCYTNTVSISMHARFIQFPPFFSSNQLQEVFGRHMVFCTNDSRTSQCSDLTIDSISRIVSISVPDDQPHYSSAE